LALRGGNDKTDLSMFESEKTDCFQQGLVNGKKQSQFN